MAGKNIYLLQFNNYFNRKLLGPYNTAEQYWDTNSGGVIVGQIKNMTLWNPSDGVDTKITSSDITAIPDYLIVCDSADYVMSRWFVIEAKRNRDRQYELTLHRDLICDASSTVLSNKNMYIERGWCDVSNPAIYNQEPITFNQIKKSQTMMYDRSMTSWIVGYIVPPESSKTISFKIGSDLYKIDINNNIHQVDDAAYAIIYLPYETFHWYSDDTNYITQNYTLSRAVAQAISREFSSGGVLLDLQLLPYCPTNAVTKQGFRDGYVPTYNIPIKKVSEVSETGTTVGYIGLCSTSSTGGTIYYNSGGAGTPNKGDPLQITVNDIKKESLTTLARIVSPNGNGVWEFVPAKQVYENGATKGFSFTMTCMPYQPYIKVEPGFGRLYGNNYKDSRGLICGGDFSMPQINDQWKAYQINNKNYQNMFNRQIESLDLQQKWAQRQDIATAITGTLTGVAAGSVVGGGVGAGIMGTLSAAGGVLDIYANKQLRADQRSAAIDQHNMQLQNIQALPYGITKIGNFNVEQPKVPYLEIYSCEDTETENLSNYLQLRSYTINRYGKITDYCKPNDTTWIQATAIKFDGISDDAHFAAALADELKQGIYITKGAG